jgi:hypothetical protein
LEENDDNLNPDRNTCSLVHHGIVSPRHARDYDGLSFTFLGILGGFALAVIFLGGILVI